MSRSSLQDEIQQTRPFRSPSHETTVALFRTTDVVRRSFSRLLERHGITLQQYNVLRILRGAGEKGLPTLAIAERMVEQTPGITRLLDRLEKKGWVRRRRAAQDRRQVMCRITPGGLELLAGLDDPMDAACATCLSGLGESELDQLIELLARVRNGARPDA